MPDREPEPLRNPETRAQNTGRVTPDPQGGPRDTDTPEQEGIEIDNAIERPQEGQPGQPGAKVDRI